MCICWSIPCSPALSMSAPARQPAHGPDGMPPHDREHCQKIMTAIREAGSRVQVVKVAFVSQEKAFETEALWIGMLIRGAVDLVNHQVEEAMRQRALDAHLASCRQAAPASKGEAATVGASWSESCLGGHFHRLRLRYRDYPRCEQTFRVQKTSTPCPRAMDSPAPMETSVSWRCIFCRANRWIVWPRACRAPRPRSLASWLS